MTAISPFPLFTLPNLAIHDVLKEIMPLELIQLSSVSKKTKAIIKLFIKRNSTKKNYKLDVRVWYQHDPLEIKLSHGQYKLFKIRFLAKNDSGYSPNTKILNFDGVSVFVHFNDDYKIFNYYCEDVKMTFKKMLHYLCNLFNPFLSVDGRDDEFLTFAVLDLLKNETAKLDEFSLISKFSNSYLYQDLLDAPIKILNLLSFPTDFQYKPSMEPMKFKKLKVIEAYWVRNLDDFLQCRSVYLRNTHMLGPDLNRFLKKWIDSDCQLKNLRVETRNEPNLREIVEGVPVEPLDRVLLGNFFQIFDDGKCFRFQRSNGEKGIIYETCHTVFLYTDSYRFA